MRRKVGIITQSAVRNFYKDKLDRLLGAWFDFAEYSLDEFLYQPPDVALDAAMFNVCSHYRMVSSRIPSQTQIIIIDLTISCEARSDSKACKRPFKSSVRQSQPGHGHGLHSAVSEPRTDPSGLCSLLSGKEALPEGKNHHHKWREPVCTAGCGAGHQSGTQRNLPTDSGGTTDKTEPPGSASKRAYSGLLSVGYGLRIWVGAPVGPLRVHGATVRRVNAVD